MRCPICGRENPEDAKLCAHCGTNFAVFQESITPQAAPAPAAAKHSKGAAPKQDAPPSGKRILTVMVACIVVLGLLAASVAGIGSLLRPDPTTMGRPPVIDPGTSGFTSSAVILPPPTTGTPPIIETGNYIVSTRNMETFANGDQLITYIGANLFIRDIVDPDLRKSQTSLDGRVHLYQNGEHLYLYSDSTKKRVADNLTDFTLSADGTAAVLYCTGTDGYSLYYFNHSNGIFMSLAKSPSPITSFCISPDGQYVACVSAFDGTTSILHIYGTEPSGKFGLLGTVPTNGDVLSISNGREFIYFTRYPSETQTELCVFDKYGIATLTDHFSGEPLILNAEHSQAIYLAGGNYCMRYRYNHTGPFATEDGFQILLPEGSRTLSHTNADSRHNGTLTLPIREMNQMLYTVGIGSEKSLYKYYSIGMPMLLDNGIQQVNVTIGNLVYYIANNTLKSAEFEQNFFVISEISTNVNPDYLGTTNDGLTVFYVKNDSLWCSMHEETQAQILAYGLNGAQISAGGFGATDMYRDNVYFLLGAQVYYFENQNVKELSAEAIFAVKNQYNTILLYSYTGKVYAVTGAKITEIPSPINPTLPD